MILKTAYLLAIFIVIACSVNQNCSTSSPLTGCITCPLLYNSVLDIDTQLYVCSDISNCTTVSGQICIECDLGLILSNNTCIIGVNFCLSYNSSNICIECQPNYYLSSVNTCIKQNISYCLSYSGNSCTKCQQIFMIPSANCNISSTVCLNFNYQAWKCLSCSSGMILDSSGLYCITKVTNCLQYTYNEVASAITCSMCNENFLLSSTTYTCSFSNQVQYVYNVNNVQQGICVNQNLQFISSTNTCVTGTTSISYCTTNSSLTQCSSCNSGYYLSSNFSCLSCSNAILKCIACSNSTTCVQCISGYYLLQSSSSTIFQCIACSTFNCELCYSSNSQIICTSCLRGYSLYQGQCYNCSAGYRFDVLTKSCISCLLITTNCMYCTQKVCTWCSSGFVLNGTSCMNISLLTKIDQNVASELIIKSFPDHETQIYKNQTQLLASCQQSTNGYSCLCSSNKNVTSLCYSIPSNLLTLPISAYSSVITDSIFQQNSDIIRMLSQLPSFNSTTITLTSGFITSLQNFANVIETISNVVRSNSVSSVASTYTALSSSNENIKRILEQSQQIKVSNAYSDSLITMFFSIATGSMINAFSLIQTTQIFGNGYYFKYNPANIADTKKEFISTNISTSNLVYVWFDNFASSFSLTGNFYVYQSGSTSTAQVKVKQLYFPSTTYSYKIYKNNILQNTTISATNDGYLTLSVGTSNSSSLSFYQVQYSILSSNIDTFYVDQRIEQIFYRMSFIYILIFLVAYLFFIPYCTIVDLCDKRAIRRKRVRSQDLTVTEQRQQESSEQKKEGTSQTSVVISVNYKDFFPIYNIANTPRPRRLLKLCLFIVNLQHGITFLTLIYFNLGPNNPVIAVVLAVPAYFCTVIMGYICGALVIFLPGATKYLINLVTIGYWILWVALMPLFLDTLYYPYIFIFAIVFILIDLLVDFLETFLVYFVVKNSQRQINMFKCIATWLSYRGFYEFDKLAKEMIES